MSIELAQSAIQDNVTIPTLPHVVAQINALVDDPDVGTREIGAAVSEDPPIAAKVLKIANSASFGLMEEVVSTEHATAVLGVRQLRSIAMQASVISDFDHLLDQDDFDVKEMWRHSILTGHVCAEIARRCHGRLGLAPDEFHVIGLLHDMGKVLLLESQKDKFLEALRTAAEKRQPEFFWEEKVLGFNHAHVGALIARQWELPSAVCDAIQFHHGPREAVARDTIVALVANVNLMVHRVAEGNLGGAEKVFDEATCRSLGVRQADIPDMVQFASDMLPQVVV